MSLSNSFSYYMYNIYITQHDLIYTFFHPILRDEQDVDKTNVLKLRGWDLYVFIIEHFIRERISIICIWVSG